ncbi:DUF1499 domain-containing protein [Xanthobacter dioxanivorans]|uniref:DUF1499 domain-containing protein n=1 Tax=Xanthobacter dioxanivorans TaxID=2528964 RepID=A0A974PRQ1_9HYPH|nr:DUF1499 domain-containing protein [Xanthobacter dioxanivorans]QRG08507.1 DUF1499 domain-containing protein [Xanthobacter dioxanivorans]
MIRRRLYAEERFSPLARWSFRLALFCLPVVALSAILYRTGLLDFTPAVVTLAAGLGLALLAAILGTVAFFITWETGWLGIGRAIAAVAIAVAVLAGPAAVLARGMMLPRLTDITTDSADPPRFRGLALAHPRESNPLQYPGTEAATAQRLAYPGIKPVDLSATPEEAFNAVLALVQKRHWRILDAIPPRGTRRDGQIEAVAESPLMGFRSDVVIRIRPTPKGARVDARSAARYGIHDLGTNAQRIESLMADLATERRKR